MKYKVGDEVTIRSQKWYEENKDYHGFVNVPFLFIPEMVMYCGETHKITYVGKREYKYKGVPFYMLEGCEDWSFSEEMFE